jgi:hypothetical protein
MTAEDRAYPGMVVEALLEQPILDELWHWVDDIVIKPTMRIGQPDLRRRGNYYTWDHTSGLTWNRTFRVGWYEGWGMTVLEQKSELDEKICLDPNLPLEWIALKLERAHRSGNDDTTYKGWWNGDRKGRLPWSTGIGRRAAVQYLNWLLFARLYHHVVSWGSIDTTHGCCVDEITCSLLLL